MSFNVEQIRQEFPMLSQTVYGKPYIYFDNAATAHKPKIVTETISNLYNRSNSNIHRGVHYFSGKLTTEYENSREAIRKFINAGHSHEVIFTKGATDSINLVAFSFGERFVNEGDEIIISEMEHHSNIVPWQMLCERKKAKLKVIPMNDNGELILDEFNKLLNTRVKIISVSHVSNSLGTINPVSEIIKKAHQMDIPVLIDGAQAIQHQKIDVQELDCDFYAFSGHKVYGPTGIGILYGKEKWLNEMPPYQGGGDMIDQVTFEKTTYNQLPLKFEAGTPHIIGAIALSKAIEFIEGIGIEEIAIHEKALMKYATSKLLEIEGLKIYGTATEKAGSISFLLNGIHPSDTGTIIDKLGIAVRTGHHCTQPVMAHFNIPGTVRASFAMYNTFKEIDRFIEALIRVKRMF